VRVALAESVMDVASGMSHEAAAATVVPLIMQFLRDDAPEVRLKILESLAKVVDTMGADLLESTVLPALLTLGADALWRVREKVIEQMPLLARALGAAVFEDKLLPLYLSTYQDQVNAVRMAATRCLEPLARHLGAGWVKAKLVPKLQELFAAEGSSYLQRITVLYGVRDLSVHADLAEVATDLLPLLLRATRDDVPNVRFVASQILQDSAGVYDKARLSAEVRPALAALRNDPDADVKYFASVALERC
jgi:serine/threonine-protein phosphatase 2A regulatory subunit A